MENHAHFNSYTSFNGYRRIASGSLRTIALKVKQVREDVADDPILIFDDNTGLCIDIDTRGTNEEVIERLSLLEASLGSVRPIKDDAGAAESISGDAGSDRSPSRGRPRLGVIPREVTLLPRHWEWLATQPGGASVTLRKLVEEARRSGGDSERMRQRQERAYRFMSTIAGDMPGYEEAIRALFASERETFNSHISTWPFDVREHASLLAFGNV